MADQTIVEYARIPLPVLKKYSKNARIGKLVGGVMHNMNGAMQILSIQMEMAQKMSAVEDGPPLLSEKIDACLAQVDRLRAMIEVLRPQDRDPDEREKADKINLNELLERDLGLFHHNLFFKHQVKVKKTFTSRMPLIQGDETDFSEALMNLIENGVEAVADSTRKELAVTTRAGDGHIQVVIADSGCGIPPEHRDHLFSPFFTTKNGDHPGLGLFLAKRLLAPYGAAIEPFFREGDTIFSVRIPLDNT